MKKLFIITGTSSGIGKALAELLLEDSYVIGISRNNKIEKENYFHLNWDLSNIENCDLDEIIEYIPKTVNEICLVNNAGFIGKIQPAYEHKHKDIVYATKVNYTAPAYLMSALFEKLKNRLKVIINIGSGAAQYPIDAWSTYCSSKAALLMYAKCFDEELKSRGYTTRVFDVAPGVVDTAMQEAIRSSNENEFLDKERFVELKRYNELSSADEVAEKLRSILQSPDLHISVSLSLRNI